MNLAIITGGSRGLGKALVELCRAEGWTVLEFSRSGSGEWHVPLDLGDIEPSFAEATAKLETLAALAAWEQRLVRLYFFSSSSIALFFFSISANPASCPYRAGLQ